MYIHVMLLPFVGEDAAEKRLNEVFSRRMLGSVIVGSSFMKIVEKVIGLFVTFSVDGVKLLSWWFIVFILSVLIFTTWDAKYR